MTFFFRLFINICLLQPPLKVTVHVDNPDNVTVCMYQPGSSSNILTVHVLTAKLKEFKNEWKSSFSEKKLNVPVNI